MGWSDTSGPEVSDDIKFVVSRAHSDGEGAGQRIRCTSGAEKPPSGSVYVNSYISNGNYVN